MANTFSNIDEQIRSTLRMCSHGVLIAAVIGFFVNILYLMVPIYMMQVYNRVLPGRSEDTLIMLTIVALGALLFLATFDYCRSRIFMIVGERVMRRLGPLTLESAVRESLNSQSLAATNAMRDLQELRQFLTSGPVSVIIDMMITPLFLVVLFLLHPAYAAVAVFAVAVLLALGLLMDFQVRRPSVRANEAAMKSHAEVGAAIRHAEVIEAMGMLPALARRWRHGQNRALAMVGIGNCSAKAIGAVTRATRASLQILILAVGAVLVIEDKASSGSIMAATMIMGRLLFPFEQLIEGWRQSSHALAALARLRKLLNGQAQRGASQPMQASHGRLVVDRLTFVPPGADRAVLRSVGFQVEPGEVLGVIGPSGAGKTTLARLIVGVWKPTNGGIYLDGQDVYLWDRPSFGRQVGYLPQDSALLNGTIRENIARFSDTDMTDVIEAARAAGVHDLIGRLPLGYETAVGEGGFMLSGGQRQRIALARALFGAPRLLVLDEPNSNMDGDGEQAFVAAIRGAKRRGASVVIIAQRMSILSVADRLLVMRDGAVDKIGERSEIVKEFTGDASVPAGQPRKVAQLASFRAAPS